MYNFCTIWKGAAIPLSSMAPHLVNSSWSYMEWVEQLHSYCMFDTQNVIVPVCSVQPIDMKVLAGFTEDNVEWRADHLSGDNSETRPRACQPNRTWWSVSRYWFSQYWLLPKIDFRYPFQTTSYIWTTKHTQLITSSRRPYFKKTSHFYFPSSIPFRVLEEDYSP